MAARPLPAIVRTVALALAVLGFAVFLFGAVTGRIAPGRRFR